MIKMSNKTVLVTGGSGFIGSHLINRLLDEGNGVVCLDNLNDFYDPRIKDLNRESHYDFDQYSFLEGDIRDQGQLNKIFKDNDIEVVIHLAAMAGVRPSLEDPKLYTDVNINGTQNLLEAMNNSGVQKFLFASSPATSFKKKGLI